MDLEFERFKPPCRTCPSHPYPATMAALLFLLTIYEGHSAQTTVAPMASMDACKAAIAQLDKQVRPYTDSKDNRVYVIARCVGAGK